MKKKLKVSKGMRVVVMAVTIVALLVIGSGVYRHATAGGISFVKPLVASAEVVKPYEPTPNDILSAKDAHEEMKLKNLKEAIIEAEKLARVAEEEKKVEEERLAEEARLAEEQLAEETQNEDTYVASTSTSSSASETSTETASSQTQTSQTSQTTQTSEPAKIESAPPAQASAPTPPPAQLAAIGPSKIGVAAGIYKSYVSYGYADTATLQAGIDAGQVVAGLTYFSGNDGETTYFAGHNPGVMSWMNQHLYNGSIVTVTDSSGQAFQYKMIDFAITNVAGQDRLTSIGQSAVSVYAFGSGQESIAIQYCLSGSTEMIFWYGVRV